MINTICLLKVFFHTALSWTPRCVFLLFCVNKPKMAHSRDLAVMDDWTLLFISYFYILISYGQTDGQTDRLTLVLVKSLSRLKIRLSVEINPDI